MQKQFQYDGSLYGITSKLFDGLFLGLLWLVCSLPVVTIGAATTALYYSVHKSLLGDREYVFKEFILSFKKNFRQATFLWILIMGVSFLLHLNIGILNALTDGYLGLLFIVFYALCSIFIIAFAIYTFAALSRFEMPTGWFVKIGIYMTIRYLPATLMLILIFTVAALLFYLIPYTLFILPAPVILLQRHLLERVLAKHSPDELRV